MTKSILMDKYSIYSLELNKSEITQKTTSEIIEYFESKIQSHPIATFVGKFDHYKHTKSIDGEINPDILDAKHIIFCFGKAIPNTKILAVRPRSIAVAELKDNFVVELMEAPNEQMHKVIENWALSLKVK